LGTGGQGSIKSASNASLMGNTLPANQTIGSVQMPGEYIFIYLNKICVNVYVLIETSKKNNLLNVGLVKEKKKQLYVTSW